MKTIALSTIRHQNLRRMLDLLTLAPAMTRQELADAAGLSLMTVTNLVELLKKQGVLHLTPIIREEGVRPAQGRKADAITLCGDKKAWLVVDISGMQLRLTLLGFQVEKLLELHDEQPGEYLSRLENFLCNAKDRVQEALAGRELLGVAIVAPGPYEIDSDTVFNQRLSQLNGVKIKALFQRCLGDYAYYVDEDVKFAVRAYAELFEQSNCEVLYYLYIGEGVGGAAVHSGNMLRGLNATAGDAGHLLDGRGCTYESRLSVAAFAERLGLSSIPLDSLVQELRRVYNESPEQYRAALTDMAGIVAEMLHSVLWLVDPTHLIIDCPFAEPFAKDFIQAIRAALVQRFAGENRMLPQISAAPQNIRSVLRGAIRVLQKGWLERILK